MAATISSVWAVTWSSASSRFAPAYCAISTAPAVDRPLPSDISTKNSGPLAVTAAIGSCPSRPTQNAFTMS